MPATGFKKDNERDSDLSNSAEIDARRICRDLAETSSFYGIRHFHRAKGRFIKKCITLYWTLAADLVEVNTHELYAQTYTLCRNKSLLLKVSRTLKQKKICDFWMCLPVAVTYSIPESDSRLGFEVGIELKRCRLGVVDSDIDWDLDSNLQIPSGSLFQVYLSGVIHQLC